ncbi:3-oxoacyl-reductase [Exophiala viscosa]|uniref:3-oxoacyl-reductase n=1 Tax=Exophiala viscosa TaxID=2486360 RepID=UPI00219249A0|nr:3-oxoacyl-reductase [Exophiala viscosa]
MASHKYTTRLAGTSVLIVGGTSGLGFGVAEALVEHGASNLYLSSSREAKVNASIDRLKKSYPDAKTNIVGLACDLGTEETLESNIKDLFNKIDTKLDHIVFTAGDPLGMKPLADVDLAFFKKCGMVRFFAPFFVTKYGASHLNPGVNSSITITTGAVAEHPNNNWTTVASYAAGLQGMTRNLALELKPIRVNLIQPGAVETELWDGAFENEEDKAKALKAFGDKMATGQVGQVEDVTESYLYAMKDRNVTGTVIRTDGGSFVM